jgi:hypothetical protein
MTQPVKPWDEKDEATLRRLWGDLAIPRTRVGYILRRSNQACSAKAHALGLGEKAEPPRKSPSDFWTEERLEFLRTKFMVDLWPASRIAAALGGGVTRSACCGMLARKGWVRPPDRKTPDPGVPVRLARLKRERATKPARPVERLPPDPGRAAAMRRVWEPLEGVEPVPFPLKRGRCNWPLDLPGEAPGVYRCGALSEGQYCTRHGAIAFRPKRAKSQPIYRASR